MANSRTDVCSYKKAWALDNWVRRLIHNPHKIVGGYVNAGQTVLDLGCGPGFFSMAMAELVGEKGKVISVDIQEEMLQMVKNKSKQQGLDSRIILHRAQSDRLGLSEVVDFALAFYMIHEVPDKRSLINEVASHLKPEGKFLIVEPKGHVSESDFIDTLKVAKSAGLKQISAPKILFSRTALLIKTLYKT